MEGLYQELVEAYARGMMPDAANDADLLEQARAAGLKLHRFKRTMDLPRVRAVLGALRGLAPESVVDFGSGRGVFLWPLLDAFPALHVTAVERDERRLGHLEAVRRGGIERLGVVRGDASTLSFPDASFDGATVLEVLEHQHDPLPLAREAVRLARRFVIASVPSKPDDNPEHLQLFTGETLKALLTEAGAARVSIDYVLGHIIAVARVGRVMEQIRKYPRTQHIMDSRLQPGDEGFIAAGFDALVGRHVVVEEKLDGANAAISFDADGNLLLQSRGHYLTGGPTERHFALLKSWANGLRAALWPVIGSRFVVYGEWLYAKHTIFYDALPHYFMEFDILDRDTGAFLGTHERRRMLDGLSISPVPVLHEGLVASPAALVALVGRSLYKSERWRETLEAVAQLAPHRPEMVMRQTDLTDLAEGLYIKVEEEGRVVGRYKYVRHDFLTRVIDSESHWQSRPILANQLARGQA